VQNEREWALFCSKVLELPELIEDERFSSNSRRSANRAELQALVARQFADLTAEQVIERLEAAAIANAALNDMAALWAHPQFKARNRWREIGTSVGPIPALLPPGIPDDVDPRMDPVPAVGEHNERIFAELGLS
jgi:itaconate CoA-transferase